MQTQTDGPGADVDRRFRHAGRRARLRAFRRARSMHAYRRDGATASGVLLGKGHLAMTIDQGPDMNRYQGLVALDGRQPGRRRARIFSALGAIPTRVHLAVAEELSPWRRRGRSSLARRRHSGAFLPKAPERARPADLHPGNAPKGRELHVVPEDDAWVEGRSLVDTVEAVELIDPSLSSEALLYRLFHERAVSQGFPMTCLCARGAHARGGEC